MGYLVQAFLDGRWHPVGDPLDDMRQAAAVRARLARGGIWRHTRVVVVDGLGFISEIIDEPFSDGNSGSGDVEGMGA